MARVDCYFLQVLLFFLHSNNICFRVECLVVTENIRCTVGFYGSRIFGCFRVLEPRCAGGRLQAALRPSLLLRRCAVSSLPISRLAVLV